MNTQHSTDFFRSTKVYFINEGRDGRTIEEAKLEDFLLNFCEGDPARAWYVKEVTNDVPVWLNDEDREHEDNYLSGSRDQADLPDEWNEVTTFEVREGKHSNISRDRLHETFNTREEAEEYILNGLYWNYCNLCDSGIPYHADTREECEQELREIAAIEEENARH